MRLKIDFSYLLKHNIESWEWVWKHNVRIDFLSTVLFITMIAKTRVKSQSNRYQSAKLKKCFMYMSFSLHGYVCTMCSAPAETSTGCQVPWSWSYRWLGNVGDWIQILCKSSMCSLPPSHLSSLFLVSSNFIWVILDIKSKLKAYLFIYLGQGVTMLLRLVFEVLVFLP